MRTIYGLLGAAAVAAVAAYVVRRGRHDRVARKFVKALRQGAVKIQVNLSNVPPGLKAEVFRGEAGGHVFAFVAKADAAGTRWTFALDWVGVGRHAQTVDSEAGGSEHPLLAAYRILLRHASESDGKPFN